MKKLILVGLLSCLVVCQTSCVVSQVSSERENEVFLKSAFFGTVIGAMPILFCAAVGSTIASISGLSSRSGELLGGLFGSLTAGCLGLELMRQNAPQNEAQVKNDVDKRMRRGCGLGMCAISFFSCLTLAHLSSLN